MRRNYVLRLVSIILAVHSVQQQNGLIVNATSVSHKARPKIDLSDPFYNGQIYYDTLTETPIGTIVYAIDEESVEVDPFANDKTKTFQLQDVVTHGNPNDKSFINHNLFTIGDGNDAIVENGSDEDDDDVIDIDGVVDKQATAHSKFANFAFNDEKLIQKPKAENNNKIGDKPSQIQLQQKHQHQHQRIQQQHPLPIDANIERDTQQGHQQTANNIIAAHSNRQMTYNNTSTARSKPHRHHNRRQNHNGKWHRRHQKWLKQHKVKSHRNRYSSASSRSGLKPQQINSGIKSSIRDPNSYPYVQAHVSFYDSSYDDTLSSNRFTETNHRADEKWPHLKRLQSQLHQDLISDTLPPYIKKYSRRNKQLIGLLEGEGMPNVANANLKAKQSSHSRRRQKQTNKWIEKNLFEEQMDEKKNKSVQQQKPHQPPQKPIVPPYTVDGKHIIPIILNSKQRYLTEKNVQSEPNGLPGEHLSLSSEDYEDCDIDGSGVDCQQPNAAVQQSQIGQIKQKETISPRADSFLFHRVATPRLVGTAAIAGGLIKQKLPFVALTDKRIDDGARQQRRINTIQNTFPLP
ncbi:uncharacterized protein LOC116339628 [Contarinia nasturtii]|uniref:uncharacterized protein LOC116339628 n=1 Tax=Contarinia nasturtii TaxID=265458 RepID=UPI0012D43F0F|nr:uncharacterized protein LOC116339628 [Contarinia nasturtii]